MEKDETIAIGWIDGGMVYSQFMIGVLNTSFYSQQKDNKINNFIRSGGLYLDFLRDSVIKSFEKDDSDWLLWVDSDIILTPQLFDMLVEKANKDISPVVSGLYFIADEKDENGLFDSPTIAINLDSFIDLNSTNLERVEWCGMGLTLIHKGVIEKLRKHFGADKPLHNTSFTEFGYIGEDTSFFLKLKELNIPVYVYPQAIATHIKNVGIDKDYYIMRKSYNNKDV